MSKEELEKQISELITAYIKAEKLEQKAVEKKMYLRLKHFSYKNPQHEKIYMESKITIETK